MLSEKDYILIERFLYDEMDTEERNNFLLLAEKDPEIKNELAAQQEIEKATRMHFDNELKKELQEIHADNFGENHKKIISFNYKKILAVAAAILIFLLVGFFITQKNTISHQKLFANYYQPYSGNPITRDDTIGLLTKATELYFNKEYGNAAALFTQYLKEDTSAIANVQVKLLLGICMIETEQYREALQIFQKIIEQKEIYFFYQANWYSALSELKMGNTEMCKKYLKIITENKNADHFNDAEDLLRKLQ
ncbi:MAG: tetratricopeptide repeat protein [Fimbriimonadaceae bacterium]|nr:tetratricopeptide repeat protein [Chitinophagales bacterium]